MTDYGRAANYPWHAYRANIQALTLSEGITTIGKQAFLSCTSLQSVVIPNSVTSIADYAFGSCSALQEVTLGDNIESMGAYAFNGSRNIVKTNVSSADVLAGISFPNTAANPVSFSKSFYVNGVEVTDVVLSDAVTSIGAYAFINCSNIKTLSIPATVTSIDATAFQNCSNLTVLCEEGTFAETFLKENDIKYQIDRSDATATGVAGPGSNWYWYADTKTLLIEGRYNMTSMSRRQDYGWYPYRNDAENIIISEGIQNIPAAAFTAFVNVKSIVIPDSVDTIQGNAFSSCTSLEEITIGTGLKQVYNYAFASCGKLKVVNIKDLAAWCGITFASSSANPLYRAHTLYLNGVELVDVVIPEGVTSIGSRAFYSNTAIKSVTLPSTLETISAYAFHSCSNLESVSFSGIKSVGSYAFYGCAKLKIVNTTDLAAWASANFFDSRANPVFRYHNLYVNGSLVTDLVIPEGVTSLGTYAFRAVFSTNSITIPESLETYDSTSLAFNINAATVYGVPGTIAEEIAANKTQCKATFVNIAEKAAVAPESVTLNKDSINLSVGSATVLVATLDPADATSDLTWTSDSAAVTVDNGVVTAVSAGTAVITVETANGLTDTCTVVVTEQDVPVMGVALNMTKVTLVEGNTITLEAIVTPDNAATKEVGWMSDATGVALVDNGVVTAVSAGTATITVTTVDGEKTATCIVTVIEAPETPEPPATVAVESVQLDTDAAVLTEGDTLTLTATVNPANATNKAVTWSTNNPDVATVDNGLVTAVSAGTATITVTTVDGAKTATCTIEVEAAAPSDVPVENIEFAVGTSTTMYVGATGTFEIIFTPENTTQKNLYWESTNPDVLYVDELGNFEALEVSDEEIIVTVVSLDNDSLYAECYVTIKNTASAESVSLNATKLGLNKGDTAKLVATVSPADAVNKEVNWISSDDTIVVVDAEGNLNAVGTGVATITVTTVDGGFEATCQVIVSAGNETPSIPW